MEWDSARLQLHIWSAARHVLHFSAERRDALLVLCHADKRRGSDQHIHQYTGTHQYRWRSYQYTNLYFRSGDSNQYSVSNIHRNACICYTYWHIYRDSGSRSSQHFCGIELY